MMREWLRVHLLPHITLQYIIDKGLEEEELQDILHECGYPINDHYAEEKRFFKEVQHHE